MKYIFIFIFIIPVTAPITALNIPLSHNGLRLATGQIPLSADFDANPEFEFFYHYKFLYVNPVIRSISLITSGICYNVTAGLFIQPNWIIGAGIKLADMLNTNPNHDPNIELKSSALFQFAYISDKFEAFLQFSSNGNLIWTATYFDRWIQPMQFSLLYSNDPVKSLLFSIRPEFFLYLSPEIGYDFLLNKINVKFLVFPISKIIINLEVDYLLEAEEAFSIGVSSTFYFENL